MAVRFAWATALLAMGLAVPLAAQNEGGGQAMDAMKPVSMGAYLAVDDVDGTAAFYEKVLGQAPAMRTPAFVSFAVAGGVLAIVSKAAFAPTSRVGDNAVPYIRVADIDAAFAHVSKVAPGTVVSDAVLREGPIALFKVRDPAGNLVEFYSLPAPAK